MRRFAILIFAAGAILGVLAWRATQARIAAPSPDLPAEPALGEASLDERPARVSSISAESRPTAERAVVRQEPDAKRTLAPDADRKAAEAFFDAKYRKYKLEELDLAHKALFEKCASEETRVQEELETKGALERFTLEKGARIPPPIEDAAVGESLSFGILSSRLEDDGSHSCKRYRIEQKEYPDLCMLHYELSYLGKEIRRIRTGD